MSILRGQQLVAAAAAALLNPVKCSEVAQLQPGKQCERTTNTQPSEGLVAAINSSDFSGCSDFSDPSESSDPSDFTDFNPVIPIQSSDLSDLCDPSDPSDPCESSDPSDPSESSDPSERGWSGTLQWCSSAAVFPSFPATWILAAQLLRSFQPWSSGEEGGMFVETAAGSIAGKNPCVPGRQHFPGRCRVQPFGDKSLI